MKRLFSAAIMVILALCGHGALWADVPGALPSPVLRLTQAEAQISVRGETKRQALSLPYAWDKENTSQQGEAVFDLSFDLSRLPSEPWGVFIQRVGNAYEVQINGVLLQRQGDLKNYNGADYAQVPRYVSVPPELLRLKNTLRVHIRADAGRKGGLTPVAIGPQSSVEPEYQRSYLLRGGWSAAIALFSLFVGLFALILWITHPTPSEDGRATRDRLFLYAAIAELAWSFAVGYMFFEEPPLPWPWWGVLPVSAAITWVTVMVLFCIEAADLRGSPGIKQLRRWLLFLMVYAIVSVAIALVLSKPLVLTVAYGLSGATNFFFGVYLTIRSVRLRKPAQVWIAFTVLANVLVGIRDLYVYRLDPTYTTITWLRYSSMLFGLTLVLIVLQRFRHATLTAHELSTSLSHQVNAKERELSATFQRLDVMAREHERTAERARILRDMHDGVGSHISAAIRQLESGRATQADVLVTLRESLDQLKLSIDAMTLPPGDVNALLANLRYRMEPRFTAMDVKLSWNVDPVPVLARLDADAMRQLQFLIFEAMSNVLQHAGARTLSIQAMATGPRYAPMVLVRVMDDGVGFDVHAAHGKGMASMRQRAEAIGAGLDISSEPGRTCIDIRLA